MNAAIDAGQIETLKKRLLGDADLGAFWDDFLTNFVENPTFIKMGRSCQDDRIAEVLAMIGQRISGRSQSCVDFLRLLEVPQFQLIHGVCVLDGKVTGVLYFPEMQAGVIAVLTGPGGGMVYARVQEARLENLKAVSKQVQ